jgi:hypothetical protein
MPKAVINTNRLIGSWESEKGVEQTDIVAQMRMHNPDSIEVGIDNRRVMMPGPALIIHNQLGKPQGNEIIIHRNKVQRTGCWALAAAGLNRFLTKSNASRVGGMVFPNFNPVLMSL